MSAGIGHRLDCDILLPEVAADRCVHSRLAQASCRSCIEACPTGAWIIDDERLGIEAARCDGCGLCIPACPEGAIVPDIAPARYRLDGGWIGFAACSRAALAGDGATGEGLLPCLHRLGLAALLDLYRQGVRTLLLCRGDCPNCPRGGGRPLEQALNAVNALLADRALAPLTTSNLAQAEWTRQRNAARAAHRPTGMGRRAFFSGLVGAVTDPVTALADHPNPGWSAFIPPGRMIPRPEGSRLALFAPRIDPHRCTGCDACARICPHLALTVTPDAYRLDPDGCTGCGSCTDLCAASAVRIHPLDPDPQTHLPLYGASCRACGLPFHRPSKSQDAKPLCPICERHNHNQHLFLVES